MDFSNEGITYLLLVIPALFALAMIVQGILKIVSKEEYGGAAIGFGIVILGLIAGTYFYILQ